MQEVNSYLRLAMMFGENQARTASTNIEKMCELILLDNYPNAHYYFNLSVRYISCSNNHLSHNESISLTYHS